MTTMNGKVALVTGAASGLGLATAIAFARSGAAVAMADFSEQPLNKAVQSLKDEGHRVLGIVCDVADELQVKAMVAQTVATFGRLDAAYNNAGVQNVLATAADQSAADFDRVTNINLKGVWSCMKYELQQMRQQGSGAIVNCSSIGGILGGAQRGTYHAAKHGVIGLTKSAALEYAAQGIRINTICPGVMHTPMVDQMIANGQGAALEAMTANIPIARFGRAEEIADAVLWLCSDAASYVIGHTLVIDGGYSIQ